MFRNNYKISYLGSKSLTLNLVAEAENHDSKASIRTQGRSDLTRVIRSLLSGKTGYYGHLVNLDSASLLDLDHIIRSLPGEYIVTESNKNTIKVSELPDGAIS